MATDPGEQLSVEHRGCRLAYWTRGDGPPVLFVQGVGVHGCGWRPQADGLAGRFRCVWFDNRGVGQSQPIGEPVTVDQMADDARAVLDAAGCASAHIVGHSLGGLVALNLALAARSRVRSLSLLCTFARGKDATRLSLAMLWTGLRTRIGTRRMRRRAFLELVLSPGELATADRDALADELAPVFGHDLADHPSIEMAQLRAMGRYDATPRLGELAGLATLVVSAAHDRIARPASGRAIAAGIPGARYVEIADAAHGLPIRQAERVNAVLAEHIGSVSTASLP
jgi:pimeloyl-ACP methyl ester carboxylesterase